MSNYRTFRRAADNFGDALHAYESAREDGLFSRRHTCINGPRKRCGRCDACKRRKHARELKAKLAAKLHEALAAFYKAGRQGGDK
jgi:7-cyano-7-deazaguanine synthase in queuosine biosynthesis